MTATSPGRPATSVPGVEVRGLSKDFGPNRVLHDVSVSFETGSIHALLGANGSGKSTLIKILAGYHEPTAGEVLVHGERLHQPITPAAAHTAGLRFVHQDLGLVEQLSVADNLALALGYESGRSGTIRWGAQRLASRRDLEAVGLDVDPRVPVSDLGPVQKTLVAMARALRGLEPGRGVLVLDEPTARLPHAQVDDLLNRCRALRDSGVALVYVSHRLDEVFAMADQATVLRDGHVVYDGPVADIDERGMTELIAGRRGGVAAVAAEVHGRSTARSTVALRLRGVSGTNVKDVDLDLHSGEIVAVTGLVGSGRSELGRLVFGAQPLVSGTVDIKGTPVPHPNPRLCVDLGVGYVPQDRKQAGMADFSVSENVCLTDLRRLLRRGMLSTGLRREVANRAIDGLDVRPADPDRMLAELSGGNQQKVILGKWLQLDLQVLVLDEPTYGVDVGARESIMGTVVERVRDDGLAVLLLDSDVELVAAYADRVLVMRRGRVVTELSGDQVTVDRITHAAYAVETAPAAPRPDALEAS